MTSTNKNGNGSAVATLEPKRSEVEAPSESADPNRRRQWTDNWRPQILAKISDAANQRRQTPRDLMEEFTVACFDGWWKENRPTAAQLTLYEMDKAAGEIHDTWRDLPPSTLEAE